MRKEADTDAHVAERLVSRFSAPRLVTPVLFLSATGFVLLALFAAFGQGALAIVDEPIERWVIEHRMPWLDTVMTGVTFLGTRYFVGAALVALVVWALRAGRCRATILVLVVAFALNPLIEFIAKQLIDRPRPDLARLGAGTGPAFPSGHVLVAVGFYSLLPVFVSESPHRYRAQLAAGLVGATLILLIGFSRMYRDVHWFTDVVGGILLGAVVVLATYRALRGHRLDPARCRGHPSIAS
jgi:undecaprenyl-diphosphatase